MFNSLTISIQPGFIKFLFYLTLGLNTFKHYKEYYFQQDLFRLPTESLYKLAVTWRKENMDDFQAKREEFLKRISKLAVKTNLPVSDIRLHQMPKTGIKLPKNTDPETARKIMKVYNEVFR